MTEASATAVEQSTAPAELPDEISLEDARDLINSWDDPDQHQNFEGEPPEVDPEVDQAARRASAERDAQGRFRSKESEDAAQHEDADTSEDETQKDAPEEEDSPQRELPRSWAKDKSDLWAKLDPALQDYLLEQDSQASKAVRQSQNELANQRKALEAEKAEADRLRKEYEAKLPSLVKNIEDALQAEFSDIKDISDVRKLQAEDPFRFQQWQLRQMELQAAQTAKQEADKKAESEAQSAWAKHVQDENAKFEDGVPEKERSSLAKMRENAPKFLTDKGFTANELNDLAAGKSKLSIYDHRIQSLVRDSMRLQEILSAPKAVAQRPVPPVQRPGTTNRVSSVDADIAALERKSELSEAEGFALLMARDKARSRR